MTAEAENGSSPRTWGTQDRRPDRSIPRRFIPTYMGNAQVVGVGAFSGTVHPHVHGERGIGLGVGAGGYGSSPRTWGTHTDDHRLRDRYRFIPTYMGNASSYPWIWWPSTVHPHVHGERVEAVQLTQKITGSSPRTWGTPRMGALRVFASRFIPTYMGNAGRLPL